MVSELKLGFVAIISLAFATISSSLLRGNYNHFQQAFSGLGQLNTPYYIFFNLFAFVVPGWLIFFSMSKIDLQFRGNEVLSLKIASSGWMITGLFPLSYSIIWLYWIHIFGAFLAFIFGPLGIITISSKLSSRVKWTYFSFFSTIIAFIIWTSILLFDLYLDSAIAQLIAISLFFFWYLFFLIKIYRVLHLEKKANNLVQINL